MKHLALLVLIHLALFTNGQVFVQPPNNEAFLQNEVAEVRIVITPNDLNTILGDSLYSDHHFPATFYYNSPSFSDTIALVGFRVRGNTSRGANKKSFKVSFNEYEAGQKFKGIEKMNLIGQHNDPSELRYWLSLKMLSDNGLICSRVSFVKLFINGDYRGLYLNVEHIDDEFLQKRFINDDAGNLYKCFWGSDLTYAGSNPADYSPTYELKTNEFQSDYSGLIQFLDNLNNMSDAEFPCFIEENFEVNLYLKTLAAEVLIGHWDGHAYNKNNFYLYQKPSDGKFVFIEYDMDNTFGIDWLGINWSTRSVNYWQNSNRPLVDRLLSYPYYRDQFNLYLEELLNYLDDPNTLLGLQQKQNEIGTFVQTDTYYSMDYGFQYSDFSNALNNSFGAHVTQGINEYLTSRVSTGFNQVAIVGNQNEPCPDASIEELNNQPKEFLMIVDLMGRKTEFKANTPLIYVYTDGSRECVMRLKE